jgi:methylphosphotriester-DNA--protein-cysteine methyltransferase
MRGEDRRSEGFFSYVRLETRVHRDPACRRRSPLVDCGRRNAAAALVTAGLRASRIYRG